MNRAKKLMCFFLSVLLVVSAMTVLIFKPQASSKAAANVTELGTDTIVFDNYYDTTMQIPCKERGGIYFLNNNKLSFYNMETGTTELLETFYCEGKYTDYSEVQDVSLVGDKLYVLVFSSAYYAGETPTVIVYDLAKQAVQSNIKLGVGADCIGADDAGRMIVADGKEMYLLSADGAQLDSYTATETVYDIAGFDSSTGSFFVVGYTNWVYWGYDHSMNVLRRGSVKSNQLSVADDYNIIISQKYFYERQRQVEAIDGKYVAIDNTFNNVLEVLDTGKYSTSTDEPDLALVLNRINNESGDFDEKACVGTRTIYCDERNSVITFKGNKTIAEYSLKTGKETGCMTTTYPVFSLMTYGDEIVAIEKNGDKFYLERFTWKHAAKVTVTAASKQVKVGGSLQLKTSTDGTLSETYTYSSNDTKIASVSQSGRVTGWKAGTATITVKTNSGLKATYTVKVVKDTAIKNPSNNVYSMVGASSQNISENNYYTYGNVVNSYLTQNSDGTLTRVEYTGKNVIVEKYSSDGKKLKSRKTIKMELNLFGGFYSGKNYNYLVFGRQNAKDSDKTEVMRVVKYSKTWKRIKSVSYKGCNTYIPFDAGSLRMTETGGKLYIHTCHEMYAESDGVHHQANMTYVIKESNMSKVQEYYDVMNIAQTGYVSHSFNQFIQADGKYIYRVDHGDSWPRGISIVKCLADGDITDVDYTIPVSLGNVSGYNDTGASVGGFELSSDKCLIAGNAVNFNKTANSYDVRNIFITATDKNLTGTKVIWLTKYKASDKIEVKTPQLVKLGEDSFMLLWEEENGKGKITTSVVTVDGAGNQTSDIVKKNVRLSDCKPICCKDGNVRWYVTDGGAPTLYTVNPYLLKSVKTTQTSISKAKVSKVATKTYTGKAIKPNVKVTLNGKRLKKNVEYSVVYLNNKRVGEAALIVRGCGKYKGTIMKTFKIKPQKVKRANASSGTAGAIKVKWKTDSQVTGYQVVYATDSKFAKNKSYKNITKKTTSNVKLTGLKSGQKYYVKVRAYKKVNGKKLYGTYSKAKAVKVK